MNEHRQELAQIIKKAKTFIRRQKFSDAEALLKKSLNKLNNPPPLHNLLGLVYHKQSCFPAAMEQFRKAHLGNPLYLEAILNLSITLCDLGCYDEAREVYEQLEKNPATAKPDHNPPINGQLANTHVKVGDIYLELGMLGEAVHELRKALKAYPEMPDVQLKLAKTFMKMNQFELARKELESLEERYPTYAQGQVYLGILFYQQGQCHLAKHAWTRAYNNKPDDPTTRAYMKLAGSWPSDPPLST